MKKSVYKKYGVEDQRSLATWAADCSERVLSFFEEAYPKDERPRRALEACRAWVRTGVFKMAVIRGASLAAHAAAREAKGNDAACLAARAAGQAVATAHVPQHAFGSAYYALKAIAAADPARAAVHVAKEHNWQARHIARNLRQEAVKRVIIQEGDRGPVVKIKKGKGF
jgi:hypothetical protein